MQTRHSPSSGNPLFMRARCVENMRERIRRMKVGGTGWRIHLPLLSRVPPPHPPQPDDPNLAPHRCRSALTAGARQFAHRQLELTL